LYVIHDLIQNVLFECCDFRSSLSIKNFNVDDFIYLDPPYVPENATSFVKYNENGFNKENHLELFNSIHEVTKINKKIIMSNADVSLVRETFDCLIDNENDNESEFKKKYNIISILCKRAINAKNPESKAKEVIIKNY
jgi:DNA adenine methylase